jgi:MFS family permease
MSKLRYASVLLGMSLTSCLGLVGAPLSGHISDRLVVYYRKKRGGEWYPEDRLRAALPGALILVPLSVLLSGLLTEYVPGTLGLVLNLVCLFMNGLGVGFSLLHMIFALI